MIEEEYINLRGISIHYAHFTTTTEGIVLTIKLFYVLYKSFDLIKKYIGIF